MILHENTELKAITNKNLHYLQMLETKNNNNHLHHKYLQMLKTKNNYLQMLTTKNNHLHRVFLWVKLKTKLLTFGTNVRN